MLVTTTVKVTETKEISKEINLPFCSKDTLYAKRYYRINADESVLIVNVGDGWSAVRFTTKDGTGYSSDLKAAIDGREVDESEIFEALQQATELVSQSVNLENVAA